jgi:branched-chain amino acid transport system substrate-binding protein
MGGDSYVVNDITALSATVADSVYFTTLGSYDRNFMDPSMVAFVKYYQKRLGEKPTNIYSAVGYDTVNILAAAMKKAKSTEPTKVATALKSMQDFSALTGDLNIGTPVVNSMVTVVKVISGKARIAALVIPQYIPQPIQFIARKKNDSNT